MTCFVLWASRRANSHIQSYALGAGRLLGTREAAWCSSQQPAAAARNSMARLHAVRFPNIAAEGYRSRVIPADDDLALNPVRRAAVRLKVHRVSHEKNDDGRPIFHQRAFPEVRTGECRFKIARNSSAIVSPRAINSRIPAARKVAEEYKVAKRAEGGTRSRRAWGGMRVGRKKKTRRKMSESSRSKRFSKFFSFHWRSRKCMGRALRFLTRTRKSPSRAGRLYAVYTNEESVLVLLCAEGKRSSPRSPARSEQSLLRFSPG